MSPMVKDRRLDQSFDTSIPAVVLKLFPNPTRYGGLGVIRSLGRAEVPVYGVVEARSVPAASSRYIARRRYVWRPDHDDVAAVTRGLTQLSERIGRTAVLLPTDDMAAIFLAEHGNELGDRFLFSRPPATLPRQVADKRTLGLVCRESGMASPEIFLPTSFQEATEFATHTGFPMVIKVTPPWLAGKVPSTSIINNKRELTDIYERCAEDGITPMMQQYVRNSGGGDWFFHGYCDADSTCYPAFTGVKERSFPVGSGVTTYGRSARNEKLRDIVTGFLARIGYCGVMDLDIRFNEIDGQYHLLDFNPRFGAQSRIFRDTAGIDVALAAYLDLTGQSIPAGYQLNNRRFMAESYDPRGFFTYWRRGELNLGTWLSQLRGTDEFSWFAADDLMPFGHVILRTAWKAALRPITRNRRDAAY